MKSAHFVDPRSAASCLGLVIGDNIIDIRAAWELGIDSVALEPSLNDTLFNNINSGAFGELESMLILALLADKGAFSDWVHPVGEVELLPPIHPRSFRDFYAFEAHVVNARKKRGLPMVPEWYDAPVFYFSNATAISGNGTLITKPAETQALDYELEVAIIIGKEGGDIEVDEADEYIAGFTILNDWSMRDVQQREMKVGLGPAKCKDFATTIGPWLVTPDELQNRVIATPRGNHYNLVMTATVNGREYSRGNLKDMNWTFAELVAQASRNTLLEPGDVIGSGTVGTGCITEFPEGTYPWLQSGDEVTLKVEKIGVLTNRIR